MADQRFSELKSYLDDMIKFIQPHLLLANSHMADFITDNLSESVLPFTIREQVSSLKINQIYEILWSWGASKNDFQNTSALGTFLKNCWSVCLQTDQTDSFILSPKNLKAFLPDSDLNIDLQNSNAAYLMSPKKLHEVKVLSEVVAAVAKRSGAACIVDIGCGKGYLSTTIALQHGLNVLGIDLSQDIAATNAKLCEKFRDVENVKLRKRTNINKIGEEKKERKSYGAFQGLCKQVTSFVTTDADLSGMVSEVFSPMMESEFPPTESHGICIAGLHTCGDLAATSIRLFCNNSDVRSLCNVGCCYNLLSEKFCTDKIEKKTDHQSPGFPMSKYMNEKKFSLGRNAKMIAAQSIERICQQQQRMPSVLFYRALLQIILKRNFGDNHNITIGRIGSKSIDVYDYIHKAQKRVPTPLKIEDSDIDELMKAYGDAELYLHVAFVMRVALSRLIEQIILLDRLLFLYEQGVNDAFLSQLFDPVISPRCYAILAKKI